MEIKILQVFYGRDGLPYKDVERKVHFPIVGSGFQGASLTTEIRFYFGQLGDSGTTWVATAKLPNGVLGSKILPVDYDSEVGEYYALLEMSAFYFQYKGDLFLTLQGYDGGIDYSYDSESELYTINGTPVIQSTGSVKLAINYATQFVGSGQTENTTIQNILALVGTKVTKTDLTNVVYGTNGVGNQTTIPYKVAAIENSIPIRNGNGEVLTSAPSSSFGAVNLSYLNNELSNYYDKSAVNTLLNSKQDNLISGTNIKTINGQSVLGSGNIEIDDGGTEVIANPTLSGGETKLASLEIDGTKYDLDNGYEKLTNKVTSLSSSSTDTQYPSAKVVYDNLVNIRQVAEGKCHTFVLSYARTLDNVKSTLNIGNWYRAYAYNRNGTLTDITESVKNGDYDNSTFVNSSFNSNADSITLVDSETMSANVICEYQSGYVFVNFSYLGNTVTKTGDIFLVIETEVPDRWVSGNILFKMETSKVDLTNYVTTNTTQTISGTKTFTSSSGIKIGPSGNATIKGGGNYVNVDKSFMPATTESLDLGALSYAWKDLYLAGKVNPNSNGYGLSLPSTASLSADSELVDTASTQTITGAKTFEQTVTVQEEGISNNVITIGDYSDSDLYSVKTPCVITSSIVNEYSANAPVNIDSPIEIRGNIAAQLNNTYDLGSSSYAWKDLYLSGKIVGYDDNGIDFSTANITKVSGHLFSTYNGSRDLGSSSNKWRTIYLAGNLTNTGSRTIDGLCGKTGTPTIESNATTLPYDTISTLSLSASTTLNLETAPSGCTPEYRAVITNSDSSAITITLPSGVKCLTNDEDNVAISSNTFTLASGTTIELNLCNSCAVLVNFEVA